MQDAAAPGPRGISSIPTVAALVHHQYRLIWSGLMVTSIGHWAQMFALGWLVVELAIADGTPHLGPLYLGLVNLARGVPGMVLGLYAGVVSDRVDRRVLLAWVQVAALVTGLALAAYAMFGHVTVLGVILLGALTACPQAFDGPPRFAMLPRLVPPRDLMSAIGLNQVAWNASTLIGPLVGGLLIGPVGAGGIFLIKALSHLVALAACLGVDPQPPEASGPRRAENPVAATVEAFRFVLADPILRWSVALLFTTSAILRAYSGLMPSISYDMFGGGAQELSWMLAVSGLGSLLGSALIAPLGTMRRRGRLLCGMVALTGALLVVFTRQSELGPGLVLLVVMSVTTLVGFGVSSGFLQSRAPDALQGRMMGLQTLSFFGLNPLGVMVFGSLAAFIGIADSLAISGALAAGIALLGLANAQVRGFGARGDASAPLATRE